MKTAQGDYRHVYRNHQTQGRIGNYDRATKGRGYKIDVCVLEGYAIGVGSHHAFGVVHVDNGLPVANLPAEVAALLLASLTVDAATEGWSGGAESFWEDTSHENLNTTMIPDGRRHNRLVTYAGRLRNAGLDRAEAEVLFRACWLLCEQLDGQISEATFHSLSCRFSVTWPEAQAKRCYVDDRYSAGHQDDGGDEQVDDGYTVCRLAWPRLSEPAFHGTAGKIVNLVAPHTEADLAAILTQSLGQSVPL